MTRLAVRYPIMTRKLFLALATLTLLTAAFLRLYGLATYPPGPHYDEAANLLIARSIAFGGARFFPMVAAYQGREVLYYYLSVPLLTFVDNEMFGLRLLSVFCNLVTIAASIALGRAMLRGRRGLLVGLIVGMLMTINFHQIWLARQAFRAVTLPLMQALALLFLWRGLNVGARRAVPRQRFRSTGLLIIAGLFAGGAVYTYNSSRLFPFWLLIGGLALLWFDRAHWRKRLPQGVIFFGVTGITALPMAIYAAQRPDVFFGRLGEVTQAGQAVTLAQSIILHLKMFFIQGDPYFRYNVAGRPYFTWPEGILLLIGLVLAAFRLIRRESAPTRAAYLLVLLSPLMVIPSVISVGGLPPSHMRSLGMVPLIFVLVALGGEWGIARFESILAHRRAPIGAQRAVPLLLIAVLLIGGYFTGDLYFHWARDPVLFYETDADLALAARWLIDQHITDEPVYLAALDKGHPTVMIEPVPPITWIGTDSLFAPPSGQTGLYIFPRRVPIPADWAAWLAPGKLDGLPLGPDGQPAFQAFRISGDTPLPLPKATITARNPDLTFAGLDAPAVAAGDRGQLTMGWRVDAPPAVSDLTPLLQIEDQQGNLIYRGDAYMAGTDAWRAGETLIQRMVVNIPPATPPGSYAVKIAWVERASNHYLSYLSDQRQGGIWAQVGSLTVTRPATFPDPAALPIGVRQQTEVAPGVTLLGWDAPPASLRPGESLPLTLYWQASGERRAAFTLTASLSSANETIPLWQGQPVADRYPANRWVAGEVLVDRERWTIPRNLAAGNYNIVLKFDEKALNISALSVAGMARIFAPPPVDHVVNVNFDNTIRLYGYTVKTNSEQFYIEIVWQAQNNITSDYKVFVHLVDSGGAILAQSDAMPQANTYPTSWWLRGEYVVDTYQIPTPKAKFTVQVGLYSPQNGQRLPILDSAGQPHGDYVKVPDEKK